MDQPLQRLVRDTLIPCHAVCAEPFIALRVAGTWTVGGIVPQWWGLTLLHTFHTCHGVEAPHRTIAPQIIRPVPRQHRPFTCLVPRPARDVMLEMRSCRASSCSHIC
eukprot:4242153-Prymnesium_polylepis.1